MSNKTKYSTLTAMLMLAGSVSAQAMLPTPEAEIDNPTNATNAAIVQQNTSINSGTDSTNAANGMNTTNSESADSDNNAQASSIQTKTVALLVGTDDQGRSTLQPINDSTQLKSGDMVEYHTYITNNSSDRVHSVTVAVSIPDQLELVGEVSPNSASGSVDGKNFNRMPLRGNIDGVTKEIPLKYYKALSWTLKDIGINETAVVKYRASVR